MEDNEIVELYLKRDESAIRHTAEKYGNRLRAMSYSIVEDEQGAQECENDTYLEAWNRIPPSEPRTYLYAFLARITRNLSLNRCRAQSALKRSAMICELSRELEECIPSPDDTECRINDIAFGEAINGFLATLDDEKRNIFVRRYFYLESIADISAHFAISKSKVKTTLFRCRNELRKYLNKEGYIL